MSKTQVPAVEGLFTMDSNAPQLIGGKGKSRDSYFFPKDLAGRDPACIDDVDSDGNSQIEEVLLSNKGKVWSFTTADYRPPPPYISDISEEEWQPFVLAAVELEKEKLVVLGQMVEGTKLVDMKIGMEVELTLEVLHSDEENEYMMWKWKAV